MKKYYYGLPDEEVYTYTSLTKFIDDHREKFLSLKDKSKPIILYEFEIDWNSERWCSFNWCYTDGNCGKIFCDNKYEPRNGKNGICKHLSRELKETGATWEFCSETGKLRKMTDRKKDGI